jgi:hypothetical protein
MEQHRKSFVWEGEPRLWLQITHSAAHISQHKCNLWAFIMLNYMQPFISRAAPSAHLF